SYTLVFEDGSGESTQEITLDYRWNIQDWNNLYGAYASRLAWVSVGEGGERMQVQRLDWRSRDGVERVLKRIEFASDLRNGMNPFLLGVATRGPGRAPAEPTDQRTLVWGDD